MFWTLTVRLVSWLFYISVHEFLSDYNLVGQVFLFYFLSPMVFHLIFKSFACVNL